MWMTNYGWMVECVLCLWEVDSPGKIRRKRIKWMRKEERREEKGHWWFRKTHCISLTLSGNYLFEPCAGSQTGHKHMHKIPPGFNLSLNLHHCVFVATPPPSSSLPVPIAHSHVYFCKCVSALFINSYDACGMPCGWPTCTGFRPTSTCKKLILHFGKIVL